MTQLCQSLLLWLMAALAVEAVTEIVVSSSLFFGLRTSISRLPGRIGAFFGELVSCGYCFSVWTSAAIAWALPGALFPGEYGWIADIGLRTFALHRVSNFMHGKIKVACDRPPQEHVLTLFIREKADDQGTETGAGNSQEPS